MNEQYPYRFKTKDELIREFGLSWRHRGTNVSFIPEQMDCLLGQVLPIPKEYLERHDYYVSYTHNGNRWSVVRYMITEIEKIPDYKPKGKIKRTL